MTPFELFRAQKYFGSLDGIRALSITLVVAFHASRNVDYMPFALQGHAGVPLFFAISGFLITTLLLREQDRHHDISLKAFYVRRSLRIFPLYFTVLLFYGVAVWFFEKDAADKDEFFHNLRYFLTYTSNWFVRRTSDEDRVIGYFLWSLSTEEQFYLVWPSIERFIGRAHRAIPVVIAVALIVVWFVVHAGVTPLAAESLPYIIITSIAPAICMGVVLAHLLHDERTFRFCYAVLGQVWMSPLLLGVVLWSLHWSIELLNYAVMAAFVGACVIREDHGLKRLLTLKPIVSVGQVSYGIYLMHMLVINVVELFARRANIEARLPIFLVALLLTWGIAWVSFHTYEARWLRLKKAFER